MKLVIYKYALLLGRSSTLLPDGAKVLKVAEQFPTDQHLSLWALVDLEAPVGPRIFVVYGTGHPVDSTEKLQHIDTVLSCGGTYVWHVFEVL